MTKEVGWKKLKRLIEFNDSLIEYSEIQEMLSNNPAFAVAYMDQVFLAISLKRMKQLAKGANGEEINESNFEASRIETAWELLNNKFEISTPEYTSALDYCTLSRKKFNSSLTAEEAEQGLFQLLFIAEKLENDDFLTEVPSDIRLTETETAVTIDGESQRLLTETTNSTKESMFVSMLEVLQSSSKESVANADSFGRLRSYMHVERDIQKDFEKILIELKQKEKPGLLLLCGSVGDGKSHLLAYMKEKHCDLLDGFFIHNDSTESYDYDKNSLETLEKVISPFDESGTANKPVIIAINLGVLHNFYSKQRKEGRFQALCDFIDSSGVFDKGHQGNNQDGNFYLLNFADAQPYVLKNEGPESPFFLQLIDKVTAYDHSNPFFSAWIQDQEKEISSAAHTNYFLLQQQEVKESIVQSLIEVMIKKKVFISTRAFYNLLFDIIVPIKHELLSSDEEVPVNDMLPNLMYGHPDRSPLLAALHEIDPLKRRLEATDRLVANLILKADSFHYVKEEIGEKTSIGAWKQVKSMHQQGTQTEFSRLFVRQHALLYRKDYDETYREFVNYLYFFYTGDEEGIGQLFDLIENVIYAWKGSPRDRYIFADPPNKLYRAAYEITIQPEVDENVFGSASQHEEVERFTSSMRLGFSQRGKTFLFELDYKLYSLLKQIIGGYRPNRQDIQDALQFSEFHDKLLQSADRKSNMLLVHTHDGTIHELKKPRFSKANYEVGKVN
ncbi:DNA phosphorothioation-dependent restriction protein DptF [Mesobacillus maritimus]|uniref:DNA phosphorothioation-dependent restriction protein DptF n=1 Tax=Mesobacillus maritimus TaxID=1643336 RepID=A0ABS7KAZ6_9BACI|nr:DNA phosphorothioation-dependent restriction protein DptF [Mesobacillus maritimus]MBY0099448.1 DNA phosphorothioation-dependent restriction protein DptF [Mesobacillus maritimus]